METKGCIYNICCNCSQQTKFIFWDVTGWLCEKCLRNKEIDKCLESVANVEMS